MGDYERQHLQPLFVEREAVDKLFFKTARDGFYGTYYESPRGANCAMIGLFGDDPNDYMAKCGARWLLAHGNIKVGIMGMSTVASPRHVEHDARNAGQRHDGPHVE